MNRRTNVVLSSKGQVVDQGKGQAEIAVEHQLRLMRLSVDAPNLSGFRIANVDLVCSCEPGTAIGEDLGTGVVYICYVADRIGV